MAVVNNRSAAGFGLAFRLLLLPAAAGAQAKAFPDVEAFQYPIGAPRAAGIVGRIVSSTRGESQYGPEREADVSIGGNLPVIGFGRAGGGFVGLTVRVTGRFSLDDPRSALISNDWVAGVHGVVTRGPWRVAAEVIHESSHLGDEYAERFGARRLDWTREVASLWIRRAVGPFDAHVVGAYTLIDELPLRRGALGAGLDYRGDLGSWLGARVEPAIGVYTELQEYADWKATTSGRAGIELVHRGRRIGISFVYLDGLSTQRQFYDRRSRYAGFELRFGW